MTHYIVHIYREMRITFSEIQAETPVEAATIARDKPTAEADGIEDCDGTDLAALVHLAGDKITHSVTIHFGDETHREAARELQTALEAVLDRDDIDSILATPILARARAAIANAEGK